MAEYIKKDEVIKLIQEDKVEITPNLLTIAMLAAPNGYSAEDCYKAINDTCDRHIKEIRNLPGAYVIERKKGKWELNAPDDFIVYCSECMMPQDSPCNFCPSCGADMRGKDNG